MTTSDYYQILDLTAYASLDEIKRAYRQKARLYHPDINQSPEAKDKFILATEAYEFLISSHDLLSGDDASYRQALDDWRKYRQYRSQQRARAYARSSYVRFRNTKFYRTTRVLDFTSIIISLLVSIFILVYTIAGYFYRPEDPLPEIENPSLVAFFMFLIIGMIFFTFSLVYLLAYLNNSKRNRKKSK